LDEKIEDDISKRKRDQGKLKKMTIGCFEASRQKEGKIGWRSPEKVDQFEIGF
jgi:hypothetical protein